MYAVIQTGGKQYKVIEGESLMVEKLDGDKGAELSLPVLMVGGEGEPKVGTPVLQGAEVKVKILNHGKESKVLVYKKRRRKGYEKKYGHRQPYTEIKIGKIEA